jgi:hypothetical protein
MADQDGATTRPDAAPEFTLDEKTGRGFVAWYKSLPEVWGAGAPGFGAWKPQEPSGGGPVPLPALASAGPGPPCLGP